MFDEKEVIKKKVIAKTGDLIFKAFVANWRQLGFSLQAYLSTCFEADLRYPEFNESLSQFEFVEHIINCYIRNLKEELKTEIHNYIEQITEEENKNKGKG